MKRQAPHELIGRLPHSPVRVVPGAGAAPPITVHAFGSEALACVAISLRVVICRDRSPRAAFGCQGISFEEVSADPHPVPTYTDYAGKDASGSTEIGESVTVATAARCVERCHSDWSCDCVAFTTKNGKCSKRRGCDPAKFDGSKKTDVYVRPGATREGYAPSYAPTYRPTSND